MREREKEKEEKRKKERREEKRREERERRDLGSLCVFLSVRVSSRRLSDVKTFENKGNH